MTREMAPRQRFQCWCGARHFYGSKRANRHIRMAGQVPRHEWTMTDESEYVRRQRELTEDDS